MNIERMIKVLLLKINKKGIDVNYETKSQYSKKFDTIQTICYLKFWYSETKIDEVTGEEKKRTWCSTKEFKGVSKYAEIIKYLKKVDENNSADD